MMGVEDIIQPDLLEKLDALSSEERILVNIQFKAPDGLVRSNGTRKLSANQLEYNSRIIRNYSDYLKKELGEIGLTVSIKAPLLSGVATLTKDETYMLAQRPYIHLLSKDPNFRLVGG